MDILRKLAPIEARYEELAALMAEGTVTGDKFVKMTKEYADLGPVVDTIRTYKKALAQKFWLKRTPRTKTLPLKTPRDLSFKTPL